MALASLPVLPEPRFAKQPQSFWAQVKLISQELGYSVRARRGEEGQMRRYNIDEIHDLYERRDLDSASLGDRGSPSDEAELLVEYLNHRADIVGQQIRPLLMDREQAKAEFEALRARLWDARVHLPMNKQSGEKQHYSYLTCMVNLLTEEGLGGLPFVVDPQGPITITDGRIPARTLSRRMDGAFPGLNNPRACWEIKEYYGTTTFGSRVADGVYETIMDGLEIAEMAEHVGHDLRHYLIVDDRFTWWDKGRSYLCRIVDMLHMGLVDEALFGREVLSEWPRIVRSWAD